MLSVDVDVNSIELSLASSGLRRVSIQIGTVNLKGTRVNFSIVVIPKARILIYMYVWILF